MPHSTNAVHAPSPETATTTHPRPWCRNIRGAPTLAKPGQAITCRTCIARNGGVEVYQSAHAALMADPEATAASMGVDPRSVQSKHGIKALAREQRVRVTRTATYEGASDTGQPVVLQRSTVVFNGSAAAFAIWRKDNALFPSDRVEQGTKGQWNAAEHTFEGLGPADVGIRRVDGLIPRSALGPAPFNHRKVYNATLYGTMGVRRTSAS